MLNFISSRTCVYGFGNVTEHYAIVQIDLLGVCGDTGESFDYRQILDGTGTGACV